MPREEYFYEEYTDFESISDCIRPHLMRARKDGNLEEFESLMKVSISIKEFIDTDEITIKSYQKKYWRNL